MGDLLQYMHRDIYMVPLTFATCYWFCINFILALSSNCINLRFTRKDSKHKQSAGNQQDISSLDFENEIIFWCIFQRIKKKLEPELELDMTGTSLYSNQQPLLNYQL